MSSNEGESALMTVEVDWCGICRDAWHGNFSEAHRWSMLVFQKKKKNRLCWMRQSSIGVILSKSAVLMVLV